MPLPVIANTARVAIEGLMPSGSAWANVIHVRHPAGAPTSAQKATVIADIGRLYVGPTFGATFGYWSGEASSLASVIQSRYTDLDGASASIVTPIGVAGANTGDPLPSGAALCLTLRTAVRGRRARGRVYWGGFGEGASVAPNSIVSTSLTRILNHWEGFRVQLVADGWELVVASYLTPTATTVTAITANAIWDSQRRRNTP